MNNKTTTQNKDIYGGSPTTFGTVVKFFKWAVLTIIAFFVVIIIFATLDAQDKERLAKAAEIAKVKVKESAFIAKIKAEEAASDAEAKKEYEADPTRILASIKTAIKKGTPKAFDLAIRYKDVGDPEIKLLYKQMQAEYDAKREAERILVEEKNKRVRKEKAEKNRIKEQIRAQFSLWDGSHNNLTDLIKKSMNDPDSYSHIRTNRKRIDDYLIVETRFRGKNVYGGIVMNSVTAKVDFEGNVLEIISEQ
jgi:hypothetical protein